MSFLTALPEALLAAAAQIQGLVSTFEAQSTGIAPSTTALAPAAADEVSVLQSQVFSTYGTLYQQISTQATAVQQQLAQTLGLNGSSYSNAESTNATNAAASIDPFSGITTFLQNTLGGTGTLGASGSFSNIANIGGGNYASAASDLLGLAGGGLLDTSSQGIGADIGGLGAGLAGFNGAALDGGAAGGLAGEGVPVAAGAGPVQLAGWTSPAGAAPTGTTVPAGMPAMATAGKSGGLGAPRYGVKPKVMPKPTTV
jgi:hypothetical protein